MSGTWEELTGSAAKYRARRDADRAAASAAAAQTQGIQEGVDALNSAYLGDPVLDSKGQVVKNPDGTIQRKPGGSLAELSTGAASAQNMINQGYGEARGITSKATPAVGQVMNDAEAIARRIAGEYYQPYAQSGQQALRAGTNLGKLTGTIASTPEEQAALTRSSPLFQMRNREAQQQLARAQRAKGISDSRFAVGESADVAGKLAAEDQDRLIQNLMSQYKMGMDQSSTAAQFGLGLGGQVMDAGTKQADAVQENFKQLAGYSADQGLKTAGIETDIAAKRSGQMTDLGRSIASANSGIGLADAGAYAAAAQNSMANFNQSSPLDTAVKIYSAGKGNWWK